MAPAPVGVPLVVTARLGDRADQKLWIKATAEGADGVVARAEALFPAVDLERLWLDER